MFSLTILGSSAALPTSERFPTAHVLNVHERFFLIDCGEGTQIQLRKYKIRFSRINHVFISHLHGDHFFGLIGMLSSFCLLGRKHPIHIYSNPLLRELLGKQLEFLDAEYDIIIHDIEPGTTGVIMEDDKLTVSTFPLIHRIPTQGYLFREKPKPYNIQKDAIAKYNLSISEIVQAKRGEDVVRDNGEVLKNSILTLAPPKSYSYAYCSDTAFKEDLVPQVANVDLLYHEATFMQDMAARATQTQHSTTIQAATIAQRANVGQLVIGHFSSRYKDRIPEMIEEAKTVFPNTVEAVDGKQYIIGN